MKIDKLVFCSLIHIFQFQKKIGNCLLNSTYAIINSIGGKT
jgi:hypothetical protein